MHHLTSEPIVPHRDARDAWLGPADRYPMYLEQVKCTQKRLDRLLESLVLSGTFEQAIVVIHGDHGSRLPKSEHLDMPSYSTLFVARIPGFEPKYDRRPAALDSLLFSIFQSMSLPSLNNQSISNTIVFEKDKTIGHPLTPFAHGVVTKSW